MQTRDFEITLDKGQFRIWCIRLKRDPPVPVLHLSARLSSVPDKDSPDSHALGDFSETLMT